MKSDEATNYEQLSCKYPKGSLQNILGEAPVMKSHPRKREIHVANSLFERLPFQIENQRSMQKARHPEPRWPATSKHRHIGTLETSAPHRWSCLETSQTKTRVMSTSTHQHLWSWDAFELSKQRRQQDFGNLIPGKQAFLDLAAHPQVASALPRDLWVCSVEPGNFTSEKLLYLQFVSSHWN